MLVWIDVRIGPGRAGRGRREGRGLGGERERGGAVWGWRGIGEFAPDLVGFAGEAGPFT